MKGLIRFSLSNPHAVIVMALSIVFLGVVTLLAIPIDILPVFKSPAVQVLTFYTGMPARGMEQDITIRMERWTGQANGLKTVESRSIIGASIVRCYFQPDQDPNGALTQVNSLALADVPNLPPGTLPPVVLPFDPTSTTPIALVALSSANPEEGESELYDVGRYQARNYIMQVPGATAPVVIGGKLRAIMLYLDQSKMQAQNLSPREVMNAVQHYNIFFPSGDVKIGQWDYALSSNSMYTNVQRMEDIPIVRKAGKFTFLRDIAVAKDAAFIQTNIVRVGIKDKHNHVIGSRKQVYIPVYRQVGASTLAVVTQLSHELPEIKDKLITKTGKQDISLDLLMDQSVYVRASISALVQEGTMGAVLCSLVILLFLGQWRMTFIAILTLPLAVGVSIVCLYYTGQTINVMTLAGLTLAIGPMIDSAIICLENTHRHLSLGEQPKEAALNGASEVAMPELVSTLCTFLVLSPLALMPGMGRFLFLPMTLAVMFSMTTAYILSRTLVPCFSAYLLKQHTGEGHAAGHEGHAAGPEPAGQELDTHPEQPFEQPAGNPISRAFARWERLIDQGIAVYVRALDAMLAHKGWTIGIGFGLLALVLAVFIPISRRDFFPDVDSGAFEIAVRAAPGTRIEITNDDVKKVEAYIRSKVAKDDLEQIVAEIGVMADWSAAYTPNSGPQDAVVKVQLTPERSKTSQEYIRTLRAGFAHHTKRFGHLNFSFDSGGLVRGALNEGKSSPINIQLLGKNQDELFVIADQIKKAVAKVNGVVDARVIESPNAPELTIDVDRVKAAQAGLNQDDVMKSLIAATNSSITYNKKNFWIDPKNGNQYFVGVQYPEQDFKTYTNIENIPINSPLYPTPIPLYNLAKIRHTKVPTEVHHVSYQPAIDLTMNVEGRDLGHVSDDVARTLDDFGVNNHDGTWSPYDPRVKGHKLLTGAKLFLTGEYTRMNTTFFYLGAFGAGAVLLIYFLMVGLDRSFIVPLAVMSIVPLCLIGILPMLYITGSAINVQSLLGFIFIVGIKVANTVLMTDYAQELRRHEGLTPLQAIRKAASLRVRPVTMTALAAFFAMIPTALALEKGSEANAPLARAILGGLLAGEPATLFVLPCVYAVLVREKKGVRGPVLANGPDLGEGPYSSEESYHGETPGPGRHATPPEEGGFREGDPPPV
jgi:multidrug efflux pump subunit AcrB